MMDAFRTAPQAGPVKLEVVPLPLSELTAVGPLDG